MTSTEVSNMMLRIDWSQVRGLKDHLARQGYKADSELIVMALYNKTEPTKTRIKFSQLQNYLFDLENDHNLTGLFVFDARNNKPLWSAKAADTTDVVEQKPTAGHSTVILDFKNMKPEQKDVWLEITISALQSYLNKL
jgi:hypothetical protein